MSRGSNEDPLGVRADFPITETLTYLNTGYMSPIPTVVRDPAHAQSIVSRGRNRSDL